MKEYRQPIETRPARLGPIAKLPVFFELAGKHVVVAGGGPGAAWKAEMLAAAGAHVRVFAESPGREMLALAAAQHEGSIQLVNRPWTEADLENAAIAVGDFPDEPEAEAFATATGKLRVPSNIVDQPRHCDFQFGAIVNRSPVVVAISTGGAAPVLAQAIRRKIEAILPSGLGVWTAAALAFRRRLRELLPDNALRRRFWEAFVDRAFGQKTENPQTQLEQIAEQVGRDELSKTGEVILVGAGPGDPELLTLKAVRAMQSAEVIIYDRLVTPEVLELARREARRIEVGKRGHGAACSQGEINALLIQLAQKGLRVVRLKGGDPAIFGRAAEEIAACKSAGIPVSVIPGINTASAAAAALTGSLTHRDRARRVQFVTGHDSTGRLPPDLDLSALSDPRATTCVYMPRRTLRELAAKLLTRGLPGDTPVALLWNVTRPGEHIERTTVENIDQFEFPGTDAPMIALIGHAAAGSSVFVAENLDLLNHRHDAAA